VRGAEADTPAARCAGAVYRAFLELERAAFADGALPKKKKLIAIGISVVINCESCMQWHVEPSRSRRRHGARGAGGG
jgi:AhpD family alkylhydroperoxidase